MASLAEVSTLYQSLKTEWAKKPLNTKKCGDILNKLKVGLTELSFLPSNNSIANQNELILARDILEIGAQWAVAVKDVQAFERYMAQLKCYYYDYKNSLPESPYTYQLLGLNLLFLLSQNRVAEFHTELELLPANSIRSNPFIKHPLELEQYLMEGSYNKIFLAKDNVPAESYTVFMDILIETVRSEISACLEKAYSKITLEEAARRLNLTTKEAVIAYGKKRGWELKSDQCYHFRDDESKERDAFPAQELVEQVIVYAKELEMIV